MDECMKLARNRGLTVAAVFSEVAQGDQPSKIRDMVRRIADARGGVIVCWSSDRWSRRRYEDEPDPTNMLLVVDSLPELSPMDREVKAKTEKRRGVVSK